MFKPFFTTVALIALFAGPTLQAQKKVILPKGAAPNAGWSYGILADGTLTPADIVSMQVYITDGALFDRMNTTYKAYFKDPKPARTTVVVSKLVGPGHVEITATARK